MACRFSAWAFLLARKPICFNRKAMGLLRLRLLLQPQAFLPEP
jgi:hypothetical protein